VTEVLVRERRGNVLVARLNRPEARNALDAKLIRGISRAMNDADADPEVRAVVLTGTGDRAFCAGMDLRAFAGGKAPAGGDPEATAGFFRLVRGEVKTPLIGAANASAVAGGLELLLGCDLSSWSGGRRSGGAAEPACASARGRGEVVVELDPERAERHGHGVVGPDGEHEVHQLLVVELAGQRPPRGVGDHGVVEQLVHGPEHGPLERRPARGVGPLRDAADLVATEPGVAGEDHVLRPLVGAAPPRRDPEDEELPLARRQRGGELHVTVEGVEGARQRRVPGQGSEGVQRLRPASALLRQGQAGLGRPEGRHGLPHRCRPLARGQRADPRPVRRAAARHPADRPLVDAVRRMSSSSTRLGQEQDYTFCRTTFPPPT
jgi:hypothetical protein